MGWHGGGCPVSGSIGHITVVVVFVVLEVVKLVDVIVVVSSHRLIVTPPGGVTSLSDEQQGQPMQNHCWHVKAQPPQFACGQYAMLSHIGWWHCPVEVVVDWLVVVVVRVVEVVFVVVVEDGQFAGS